jgi:uncharacterized protein (TIGR00725 family)
VTTKVTRRPIVGIIGASQAAEPVLDIAEEVGAAIARQGWHLITGGGGGVMRAASLGFSSAKGAAGGVVIGLLPSDGQDFANEFVEIAIPTGMGIARNAIVARASQALVAVGGCAGTLSEIAFGWQLNRPIVAMSASGGWAAKLAGTVIDERSSLPIFEADTVSRAMTFLKDALS